MVHTALPGVFFSPSEKCSPPSGTPIDADWHFSLHLSLPITNDTIYHRPGCWNPIDTNLMAESRFVHMDVHNNGNGRIFRPLHALIIITTTFEAFTYRLAVFDWLIVWFSYSFSLRLIDQLIAWLIDCLIFNTFSLCLLDCLIDWSLPTRGSTITCIDRRRRESV